MRVVTIIITANVALTCWILEAVIRHDFWVIGGVGTVRTTERRLLRLRISVAAEIVWEVPGTNALHGTLVIIPFVFLHLDEFVLACHRKRNCDDDEEQRKRRENKRARQVRKCVPRRVVEAKLLLYEGLSTDSRRSNVALTKPVQR